MDDFIIDKFLGLNTAVKDTKTLRKGTSPDSLNWLTSKEQDSIELRRGYARLGATENTGTGKITGLGVGVKYDGTEVAWLSYGKIVKYYDADSDDTVEVGSNLLGTSADGEDVWFAPYQSMAGSFMYLGSPNSGIYKIPAANPADSVDQSVNNYRFGVFHIGQNRSFAGQRNGTVASNNDKTGLFLSYIDKDELIDYTEVTAEAYDTGDGTEKTFTHTADDAGAPKTIMYATVTDGTETFIDDRNGLMVGDKGGTGTVNYATGAMSVTFKTAPNNSQAITCGYYHETSTTTGILDYGGGANGQGKSFRQDDGGGNFMAIFNINTIEYCFHLLKTWQLTTTLDDTNSTNLPYRNVGIPYTRSACQTPEGIIFVDNSSPAEPKFRRMEVLKGTGITTIEPLAISDALDLTGHAFEYSVAFRWGDYEIFCVQEKVKGTANDYNSVMYVRNTVSKVWDKLNYFASVLGEYNGSLIAGDSISDNVYTLFSGYDEDGDIITNYWTSSDLNLGTDNLKNCRRMVLDGLIVPDQDLKVSLSYDGGVFTEIKTIEGDGSYVDLGTNTYIGAPTIGSKVVGGGGATTAHPYRIDFPINSGNFTFVRVKIEAQDVGFVSVNSIKFKDIRSKGRRSTPERIV